MAQVNAKIEEIKQEARYAKDKYERDNQERLQKERAVDKEAFDAEQLALKAAEKALKLREEA